MVENEDREYVIRLLDKSSKESNHLDLLNDIMLESCKSYTSSCLNFSSPSNMTVSEPESEVIAINGVPAYELYTQIIEVEKSYKVSVILYTYEGRVNIFLRTNLSKVRMPSDMVTPMRMASICDMIFRAVFAVIDKDKYSSTLQLLSVKDNSYG